MVLEMSVKPSLCDQFGTNSQGLVWQKYSITTNPGYYSTTRDVIINNFHFHVVNPGRPAKSVVLEFSVKPGLDCQTGSQKIQEPLTSD